MLSLSMYKKKIKLILVWPLLFVIDVLLWFCGYDWSEQREISNASLR